MISLNNAVMDKNYVIKNVKPSSFRRRFNDIGIIPGISIKKVLCSPFGGISAYSILGTLIAIRDNDARDVEICYEEV